MARIDWRLPFPDPLGRPHPCSKSRLLAPLVIARGGVVPAGRRAATMTTRPRRTRTRSPRRSSRPRRATIRPTAPSCRHRLSPSRPSSPPARRPLRVARRTPGDDVAAESVEVESFEVDGETATAEATFTGGSLGGQAIAISLVKEEDQWKLDALDEFIDLRQGRLRRGPARPEPPRATPRRGSSTASRRRPSAGSDEELQDDLPERRRGAARGPVRALLPAVGRPTGSSRPRPGAAPGRGLCSRRAPDRGGNAVPRGL